MDRSQFLQHFDALAETPYAVEKLRAFVLNLAVCGRLVPQSNNPDNDATWQKFCRGLDEQVPNLESPTLFEIPSAWHWAALNAIAEPCGQKKPNERFTYVDVGCIDNIRGVITPDAQVLNADEAPSRARKLVRANSVIYSTVRPYLRNIAVIEKEFDPPAIVSTAFAVLHPKPFLNSRFLFHWLRSARFQEDVAAKMKGVAYPAISDSEFWECPIPVPPPEEQRRIVAKVEELLALCDELEARQSVAREHRTRLVRSALDHLTNAKDEPDFRKHSAFVLQNSDLILDSVPDLRRVVLSLAVQGRIVPQNSKDESAAELFERIIRTKAKAIETRKKPEPLEGGSIHEPPYQLPKSWQWARFDEVATIKSNLVAPAEFRDHPHVAPDNIEKATGRLLDYSTVKEDEVKSSNHRFFPGQIIYSKIRPNLSKATIVDFEGLCSADMYPVVPHINSRYLLIYILSSVFLGMAVRNDTRVAMPKINQEELNQILVAVPPLAEQKRIVAKVEELMRWCDALEARLTAAQTTAAALLDATLHKILAP